MSRPIPSLRRMWTMYKKLLVEDGLSRRDQVLAQAAFCSATGVLRVLDYLVEDGDVDELQRVIQKHGRTIRVLQGMAPHKRRH